MVASRGVIRSMPGVSVFFKCQPKQGSIDDCDVVQGMKKMEAGSFMPRYCVLFKCVSCVYKKTAVKYVTQLGVNLC